MTITPTGYGYTVTGLTLGTGISASAAAANRTALQDAFNYCGTNRAPLQLPADVIEYDNVLTVPSDLELLGRKGVTTLRLANPPNTTSLTSNMIQFVGASSSNRVKNITIKGVIFDGNAAAQNSAFWMMYGGYYENVLLEDVHFKNLWNTAINFNESDTDGPYTYTYGGITYHLPPLPDGWQSSERLTLRRVTTDGSNQRGWVGDQVVIARTDRVLLDNCAFKASGQNLLALQFCTNWEVRGGRYSDAARHIYLETCQRGKIHHASFDTLRLLDNGASSGFGGDNFVIWVSSADGTYPGAGYNGCTDIDIHHNTLKNFSRSSGSGKVVGIGVTGPSAAKPATRIRVNDNTVFALNGGGGGRGIRFEGYVTSGEVHHNHVEQVDFGMAIGDSFLTGGYPGLLTDFAADGNVVKGCGYGLSHYGSGHVNVTFVRNRLRGNSQGQQVDAAAQANAGYFNDNLT
jgi:hypothetical protein